MSENFNIPPPQIIGTLQEADITAFSESDPSVSPNKPEIVATTRAEQLFALPSTESLQNHDVARRMTTTKKSTADAAFAYRCTDQAIKDIFSKFKTSELYKEADMPELARTNQVLRTELGSHLLEKIQKSRGLPPRVYSQYGKRLNHGEGYDYIGSLNSPEAVALLAVAMLDGTYKIDESTHDSIALNDIGIAIQGQHRWSAYKVLGTPEQAYQQLIK